MNKTIEKRLESFMFPVEERQVYFQDDPHLNQVRLDNIMRLDRALARLSDDHRLVVLLHDTEGYQLNEIQELTGTPIGTLKSRLHRARARLREILATDGTKPAT